MARGKTALWYKKQSTTIYIEILKSAKAPDIGVQALFLSLLFDNEECGAKGWEQQHFEQKGNDCNQQKCDN